MLVHEQLETALSELDSVITLGEGKLLVVGASTSEIAGYHIGSAGSEEIATAVYDVLHKFQRRTKCSLAFQGCEHINRGLVVNRSYAENRGLTLVSVVPHRHAGGALAAHAYTHMDDAVVVEHVSADAGIDIGATLIGMHLKHVAVPVRSSLQKIGEAPLTMARTRPKYIGGPRASYTA